MFASVSLYVPNSSTLYFCIMFVCLFVGFCLINNNNNVTAPPVDHVRSRLAVMPSTARRQDPDGGGDVSVRSKGGGWRRLAASTMTDSFSGA